VYGSTKEAVPSSNANQRLSEKKTWL